MRWLHSLYRARGSDGPVHKHLRSRADAGCESAALGHRARGPFEPFEYVLDFARRNAHAGVRDGEARLLVLVPQLDANLAPRA